MPGESVAKKMVCLICDEEYGASERTCPFDQSTLVELHEPWKPGMVVGEKYEILDAITDGGMGRIYKARHTLMNRIVAIKTILPTLITNKAAMKRLMQEASALSILDHPHILRVTDVGVEGGQPYLVMDFIQGTNLDLLVKEGGALSAARAVPMFIAAAAGLEHAHQRKVIHRDIKPANIMLCHYDGNSDFVKIVDFGIAKLDAAELGEAVNLTATGEIFGSPQYMSPEQCGAKPQDVRSDVYSLGCVMYFALTGHAPFLGGSPIECMYEQVHGAAKPFSEAVPGVQFPRGLEEIVFKCLSKSPDERYQTMEEVRQALDAVRVGPHVTVSIPLPAAHVTDAVAKKIGDVRQRMGGVSHIFGDVNPGLLAVAVVGAVIMVVLGVSSLHTSTQTKKPDAIYFIPPEPGERNGGGNSASAPSATAPTLPYPVTGGETTAIQATPQASPQLTAQPSSTQGHHGGVPVSPGTAGTYSLNDYYRSYMDAGNRALNLGDLYQARSYFKAAHEVAGRFGNNDTRYVDSLEALGRVLLKQGDYQSAKSALDWVAFEKKRRYGVDSQQAKQVEKELEAINRALAR